MEDSINDSKIYEIAPPASYNLINYSSKLVIDNINNINIISKLQNNLKENFNNLNRTKITIPFKDLKILKKEYLIKIIEFMKYMCNIYLQKKYLFCNYSIFKVIKDKKNNFYEIVINNNNREEIFEDIIEEKDKDKDENIDNQNKIICKEEKEFLNNNNIINDEDDKDEKNEKEEKEENKENFFCVKHNLNFDTPDKYFMHCRDFFEEILCQKCGKKFTKMKKFRKHVNLVCQKEINVNKNNNKIINNIQLNEGKNENIKSEMIKYPECDLIFLSIESMTMHFYEIHEKYKRENIKKNEIKKKEENINIKKKEIEDRLAKRLEMIREQDKNKEKEINNNDKNNKDDNKQIEIEKNEIINENNKNIQKEEMLNWEKDVKKQEEIIIEELVKRKNEKINQRIINRQESSKKVKNKNKLNKKEKRQLKSQNKEKKLKKEEIEEIEELKEIQKEKETEIREEKEELEELRKLDELKKVRKNKKDFIELPDNYIIYANNKKKIDEEKEKKMYEKEKRINEEYKKFKEAKRERLLRRQKRTELNDKEKKFLKEMEIEENEKAKKELNKEEDKKKAMIYKCRSPVGRKYICKDCNKSFLKYYSMVEHCKAKKHSGY